MEHVALVAEPAAPWQPALFSTDAFGHWGETVSEKILSLQAQPLQPAQRFQGQALIARFHDSVVADIRASAHRVMRTRRLVATDDKRYFKVIWQLDGINQLDQQAGTTTLHPGQWAIYDTSRPYAIETSDNAHFLMLLLPLGDLANWGSGIERITGKALPAHGTAEVARVAVSSLLSGGLALEREGQRVLQDSVLALMGTAIRQVNAASAGEHKTAHRKLQMAQAFIERNLTDPELTADGVAQQCGMSRRSLYSAFNSLAQTPHSYIKGRRLALACELLAAPEKHRTITQIAYELGFADAAHFSRLFSERYDLSPSQWRDRQVTGC